MLEPVREHDASVLAGLMKGDDGNLAEDFIHRAYTEANGIHKRRKSRSSRSGLSATEIHGPVLALAACVLSVPYDMPSWLAELVTLLARITSQKSSLRFLLIHLHTSLYISSVCKSHNTHSALKISEASLVPLNPSESSMISLSDCLFNLITCVGKAPEKFEDVPPVVSQVLFVFTGDEPANWCNSRPMRFLLCVPVILDIIICATRKLSGNHRPSALIQRTARA
ncbi:hypothetical protein Leryth_016132 [Lithospermum erythrorhizon]|nr:hypothetical protein Leryth_016132 [Lithospermum erythrorhizon]